MGMVAYPTCPHSVALPADQHSASPTPADVLSASVRAGLYSGTSLNTEGLPMLSHWLNALGFHASRFNVLASMIVVALLASLAGAMPPGEDTAKERIEKSPRHAEYVDVSMGEGKSVRAYVVYPEVKEKAPVVIVIHEIYGLTDWIKSVADALAADGFIAIAPDFLSGKGPNGGGTEAFDSRDAVTQAVRAIQPDDVAAVLDATRQYATALPAAAPKFATIGFCWGGTQSFTYAVRQPALSAAVVYYGSSPKDGFEKINAPVLGLYGGDDARVNATVPPAEEKMKSLGKLFQAHTYDGAGHGFLRNQSGRDGANQKAANQAWPTTITFLREHLK